MGSWCAMGAYINGGVLGDVDVNERWGCVGDGGVLGDGGVYKRWGRVGRWGRVERWGRVGG